MNERYTPSAIEPKWQTFWDREKTFATSTDQKKPKAYVLDMFPYPSGAGLHVGHPEGYTATDIVARYLRAKGFAVLHPMGWDAFGLPAEQHAIKTGTHPRVTTAQNIATFKRQLKSLGFSYDWDREIDTTDPKYVKWTQWIFLKLFHRGLAYQSNKPVNWCPALGTVLANEEVKDGKSDIGGHPVVRTPLRQWNLKITAYADRLQDDLAQLDWPEGVRVMQHEWIGKSEGAEVRFAIDGHDAALEIFTTRPDTLFGATFMVIAPEHPLVERITTQDRKQSVMAYVAAAKNRSDLDRSAAKDKTGEPTGAYAINPVNGAKIPIWVADYVMMGYGTGAIMAVPGGDERDFEFATKFGLPVIQVVSADGKLSAGKLEKAISEYGIAVNSGPYDGMKTADAKAKITADLEAKGLGKKRIEYKLRDWLFSRQRYWGEPIPVYFPVDTDGDPRKGAKHTIRYDEPIPVPESELPLLLPELEDFKPGEDPAGPLARATDWRFFQKDGKWFARETNTMPQWAGSCWYYLRFIDAGNDKEAFSQEAANRWLPVDLYVGGAEHAVLHLLYARFWHKVLFDEGLVKQKEPFQKLVNQGMILGELEYVVESTGQKVSDEEVEKVGGKFVLKSDKSKTVDARAHKMSKSRGNVINPDEVVNQHGADSLRLYEMFMGPLEQTKPWDTRGVIGVRRFLDKLYTVATRPQTDAAPPDEALRSLHRTIKKVGEDIEGMRFNTAISALMVLVNDLSALNPIPKALLGPLVQIVAPFAPHLAEELWEMLGHKTSVALAAWPKFDPALCELSELTIPVQINGKKRAELKIGKGASEADVVALATADANVAKYLEGKAPSRVIWVQDRILTLVVK